MYRNACVESSVQLLRRPAKGSVLATSTEPAGVRARELVQPAKLPIGQPVELRTIDSAATPGFTGGRTDGIALTTQLAPTLAELQEKLFAEGTSGMNRSVLLVLQGMDTAGKGGTVKHVLGQVDPMGVHYHAFNMPTVQELSHDFLWRIRKELPRPGIIGVFDRSHYEDVVATRVHGSIDRPTWLRRFAAINRFENDLVANGTAVIKCFLHISADEQRRRLMARLTDPTKQWKFNPHDTDERARWSDYSVAYSEALERTNTEVAPWHIIPADRKWWRNLMVTSLLIDTLEGMSPAYPAPPYDVDYEMARLME
jgi:PPK2 family polyphosphate:nucleotide phosphotransferase